MPSQKSPTPLALEWLCFIRDHGLDIKVTLGERALASLLPTYGQGKNIFVTMKGLARVTGWSRNTVTKHRDGLIAKGLLEDITGDPDKQERTYRLIMPGYVSYEEGSAGTLHAPEPAQELSTPCSDSEHPPAQILSTPCSESEHNIKPVDQAVDQATSSLPAAPEEVASQSFQGQSQSQTPNPGGASSATGSLASGDPENTFIFWRAKSGPRKGEWVEYTTARPPRHQPKDAVTVSLSSEEARYLRETWPMLSARSPALRAEHAEQRARFLLTDPDERAAVVFGTQSDEQGDPEDRILAYVAGHDELDARSGLPAELADIGMLAVLDFCEKITGLYGSKSLRRFGLTDEGRRRLARDFPDESVWRRFAKRRNGISEYELSELDENLDLPKGTALSVLEQFRESGHVVKDGSCYRIAAPGQSGTSHSC